jgi:ketosteroid isomerase-like protein
MSLFFAPALAADADQNLKREVEKVYAAYAENFNQQNSAGIAALYATGGMAVNATGVHTDIAQIYDGVFKAGFDHNELTVQQVWPLGTDVVLAMGEYHITGKNPTGALLEVKGIWTSTNVREGGGWKIRMLSAFPKAPPPKE